MGKQTAFGEVPGVCPSHVQEENAGLGCDVSVQTHVGQGQVRGPRGLARVDQGDPGRHRIGSSPQRRQLPSVFPKIEQVEHGLARRAPVMVGLELQQDGAQGAAIHFAHQPNLIPQVAIQPGRHVFRTVLEGNPLRAPSDQPDIPVRRQGTHVCDQLVCGAIMRKEQLDAFIVLLPGWKVPVRCHR